MYRFRANTSPISIGGCMFVGESCSKAADGYVPSDCQGNGVPCKYEDGAQRLGSKELHVSIV